MTNAINELACGITERRNLRRIALRGKRKDGTQVDRGTQNKYRMMLGMKLRK